MCRDANSGFREGTSLEESDRIVDRLSHELKCLIDLGVLSPEEEAAFLSVLEDLRILAARVRTEDPLPAKRCGHELFRMIGLLAADIDLAYQRLGFAA